MNILCRIVLIIVVGFESWKCFKCVDIELEFDVYNEEDVEMDGIIDISVFLFVWCVYVLKLVRDLFLL